MLNDYSYRENPAKQEDSRWVHRIPADPQRYDKRTDPKTVPGQVFQGLLELIKRRKEEPLFSGNPPVFINCGNPHVFGYIRRNKYRQILLLNNFSDFEQRVPRNVLRLSGLGAKIVDNLSGETFPLEEDLTLKPFQFMWLRDKTQ